MYDMYRLYDNKGKFLKSSHNIGILNEFIQSTPKEERTYPYTVTNDDVSKKLVVTEKSKNKDWRNYEEDCMLSL